jgi:iduronate 2-sulfatase
MKTNIPISFASCIFAISLFFSIDLKAQQNNISTKKKNILFIAIDDLRPELNCYGASYMKTPNIDRLAKQGLLFENAYCQQAVCAPSRNSIMTGLRPDAIKIYDLGTFFRKTVPNIVTLPQQFKNNGYISETVGKIYHTGHGNQDDELSWSVPSWNIGQKINSLKRIRRNDTTRLESSSPKINNKLLPYYKSNAPEKQMVDAIIAEIATERIHTLKNQDKPFFLAVGFKLPHLPFVAPAKYWNLYNPNDIIIPEKTEPKGASKHAFIRWSGELQKYHGIEQYKDKAYLPDDLSRNLIHGYYSSVSMVDAQVGKLLDALEKSGLRENTIIVLWGDHGWKLGEYGMWSKHSNSELDTRSPLIISAPDFPKGKTSESLAELIDVYPTLCDLSGIEKPNHLQGKSLVPILKNSKATVKHIAMSQYPRGKFIDNDKTKQEIMGYSITDGHYRFTRWQSSENPKLIIDKELYDHKNSRIDSTNLANSKKYSKELIRMEILLNEMLDKN